MAHQVYSENGIDYPSVTTILGDRPKPWLDKWKDKWGPLADRKVRTASAIGDAFHAATEKLARGEMIDASANRRLLGMLQRVDTWLTTEGFKPVEQELHVVSYAYKFSGTLDAIGTLAKYGKELVLIDWKTSAGIYDDMELQLAAYAQGYKEKTGVILKRGIIVQVSKDKPKHKLTVKEYALSKRTLNKFLKRLADFNKYAIKRTANAPVGAKISTDGILDNPSQAEG